MNNYLYPPEPGPSAWEQIQQIIVCGLAVVGIFALGGVALLYITGKLPLLGALL